MEKNPTVEENVVEGKIAKKKFKINKEIVKKTLVRGGTAALALTAMVLVAKTDAVKKVISSEEDKNVIIGDLVEHEDGSTSFTVTELPVTTNS